MQFWKFCGHCPLVALLVFAEVKATKQSQVWEYSLTEWWSVFSWPHFQICYAHPTKEFPACKVNKDEEGLESNQG